MKSRLYILMSKISCSLKVSLPLSLTIEVISNLQIVHIILKTIFPDESEYKNEPLFIFTRYLFYFFGGYDPLYTDQFFLKYIWMIFASYLGAHLLLGALILLTHPKRAHNKVKNLLKTASLAYLLHSRIIFFLSQYFLMSIISSYPDCDLTGDTTSFQCQSVWFGITIVFCIGNFGLGLAKEFLLYEINKHKKNTYAIKNNLFHKMIFLYKALAITTYFLLRNSNSPSQINPFVNVFLTFFSLVILFMKLPFYDITVFKASLITNAIAFSFSVVSVIGALGVSNRVLELVWISLTPLLVKGFLILFNRLSHTIMEGKYLSPTKAIHYVMMLEQHNFGYSPSLLYNEIKLTVERVVSKGVLVQEYSNRDELNGCKTKKEYEEKMYTFLLEKLNPVLEKNPNSELLLLFMAQIYLKKVGNIPKAINMIKRAEILSSSIPTKNSLYSFNHKLSELYRRNHINNDHDSLNLIQYFQERRISNSIKEVIQFEVNEHLAFWSELKKNKVDIEKVIELARKIEVASKQVEQKWQNQVTGITRHFLNSLIMYGAYLDIVKEYHDDARKLLKEFWNLSHNPHEDQIDDIYSDDTAIVLVSVDRSTLGLILDASGSAQTLFDIDKRELIGKSVTTLLPSIVAEDLLKYLDQYAKKPTGKLDYHPKSYGKSGDGDFFEIELYLKIYPEVSRQIKVMVLFKKLSVPKPTLIVDNKGIITEYSESLKNIISIDTEKHSEYLELQKVAPEFQTINTAFNQVYDLSSNSTNVGPHSPKGQSKAEALNHHASFKRKSKFSEKTIASTYQYIKITTEPSKHELARQGSIENLPPEEAKQICNEFSQGSKLKFMDPKYGYETEYNVQITPFFIDGHMYKVIGVTTTTGEESVSSKLLFKKKQSSVAETPPSSGFAGNFPDVDEQKKEGIYKKRPSRVGKTGTKLFTHIELKALDGNHENEPKILLKKRAHTPIKRLGKVKSSQDIPDPEAKLDMEREGSVSSTTSRSVVSIRALKSLFNKSRSYSLSRKTTVILLVIMVFMVILAGVSYSLSQEANDQVETGIEIINMASLRLSKAIRGWQTATRFFLRYLKLVSGNSTQSLRDDIYSNGMEMIQYNKELLTKFSTGVDNAFVHKILDGDTKLWDLYSNGTTNGGSVNTFVATNHIARKMLFIGNSTLDPFSQTILDPAQYIANNTANDYLIDSESLIVTTQDMLQDIIKSNISNLKVVLGLQMASLLAICFSLVIAAGFAVQSYHRLFTALLKIEEGNIEERLHQLHKMKSLLNEDLDTRKFSQHALQILMLLDQNDPENAVKEKSKMVKRPAQQTINERMILRGMLKNLARSIGISLIVVQVSTVLFVTSLLASISNFTSLQNVNTQLSVTTRAGYEINSIFGTFYVQITWQNDTSMMVRNDKPRNQLEANMRMISNINDQLLSVFARDNGEISDPIIGEILKGALCQFLSDTVQAYCTTATANGDLGLLGVNSKLYMTVDYYTKKYFDDPTYDNAKGFFSEYASLVRPCVDTLDESYRFINSRILQLLKQDLENFNTKTNALHLGILFVILFCALFLHFVSVRKLRTFDMCRGLILRAVSFKILFEDKAIAYYLNKYFISKEDALSASI